MAESGPELESDEEFTSESEVDSTDYSDNDWYASNIYGTAPRRRKSRRRRLVHDCDEEFYYYHSSELEEDLYEDEDESVLDENDDIDGAGGYSDDSECRDIVPHGGGRPYRRHYQPFGGGGGAGPGNWNEKVVLLPPRVPYAPTQTYAPDRWPPILDFIFVFSSFVAALVAAYFTIF